MIKSNHTTLVVDIPFNITVKRNSSDSPVNIGWITNTLVSSLNSALSNTEFTSMEDVVAHSTAITTNTIRATISGEYSEISYISDTEHDLFNILRRLFNNRLFSDNTDSVEISVSAISDLVTIIEGDATDPDNDDDIETIMEATQSANIGQHKVDNNLLDDDPMDDNFIVVDDTNPVLTEALFNKKTKPYLVMVDLVELFLKDSKLTTVKSNDFDYVESDSTNSFNRPSAKVKLTQDELDSVEDLLKRKTFIKGKPVKDNKGIVVIPANPSKSTSNKLYDIIVQPATKLLKVRCLVNPEDYNLDNENNDYSTFGDDDSDDEE